MNTATQPPVGVCFVSPGVYPLFNPNAPGMLGGSQVDAYMIATELANDKRFRVSIVTDHFDQPGVETRGNITIHRTADISYHPLRCMGALWRSLRAANADIYFAKGASLTTGLVALFCRMDRKSFFLRTSSDFECGGTYLRSNLLKGQCFLWSLKAAKCVFVQTANNIPNLKQSTKVDAIAIPNGHRIAGFQDTRRDFILWVGRIAEVKQPGLFMRLAWEVPSERFVMICQARAGNRRYGELARMAAGVANLHFIEFVRFQEIEHYFRRAKVLVNTSRSEGFPNTFLQAGSCGAAILSLKVNPDGVLDRFKCGFCANGDWGTFVNSLRRLLCEDLYLRIGENARKYVEENHDIRKIIDRYKDCFLSAVSRTSD
jgi:glycosyltransferase involved in cell wall biosynthesis